MSTLLNSTALWVPRWLRNGPPWALIRAAVALRELLEQRLAFAARLQVPSTEQPLDVWDALAAERNTAVSEFGTSAAITTLRRALRWMPLRGTGNALASILLGYFTGTNVMIDIIANNGWMIRVKAQTGQILAYHRGEVGLWPFTVAQLGRDAAQIVIAINNQQLGASGSGGFAPLTYDRAKLMSLVRNWVPEHARCTVSFCYGHVRPLDYWPNPSSGTANQATFAEWGNYTMDEMSAIEMRVS